MIRTSNLTWTKALTTENNFFGVLFNVCYFSEQFNESVYLDNDWKEYHTEAALSIKANENNLTWFLEMFKPNVYYTHSRAKTFNSSDAQLEKEKIGY